MTASIHAQGRAARLTANAIWAVAGVELHDPIDAGVGFDTSEQDVPSCLLEADCGVDVYGQIF
jgi:hypothetical protein